MSAPIPVNETTASETTASGSAPAPAPGGFRRVDRRGGALRVVQVGAGEMGRSWLRTVADSPDVELVGIVDLDLDAARAGAQHAGLPDLPVDRDLAALVARVSPDAVLDVTVPVAHQPVTMQALRLGLPVLGEKPAAQSVAEALSLTAAAEVTGELFMVSQSRRYNDQLVALKAHAELLGEVGMVSTSFARAPHFGGFREQMDDVLLLDMAIHAFDSARYLIGRDPVSVWCDSWNPSWSWYRGDAAASAVIGFEGGVRYSYDGSWCSPGAETSWNGAWRVSGSGGTALWSGDDEPVSEIDGAPDAPEARPTVGVEIAGSLAAFARALRTGERPDGEVHGNVMSLVMVEAAIRSTRSGERVLVDDVLEQAHREALAAERDPEVRARLESWTSVRAALQGGASATGAGVVDPTRASSAPERERQEAR
jgi:predicted dehydrogenase